MEPCVPDSLYFRNNKLLIPYGLTKEGQLIHVSKVPSGLACDCLCPHCRMPLLARKGSEKVHHFAHHNDEECAHALESTLHLMAKEVLLKEKRICLPSVTYTVPSGNKRVLYAAQEHRFESIVAEKRFGSIVPDIIARTGNSDLFIELYVTHRSNTEKQIALRKANVSAIEVDLSSWIHNMNEQELAEILVHHTQNKTWIHNKKAFAAQSQALEQTQKKPVKTRQKKKVVYHCPLKMREWKNATGAYVEEDCSNCLYQVHRDQNKVHCEARWHTA